MSNANPGNVPLSTQVSRAVVWNTIFVPLRLLAEVLATLVKLNLLSQAGYGLLALIGGANNGLGTAVDMGTQRALPKYIPEVNRSGGPAAVLRFLTAIFAAQMGLLLVIGIGLSSLFREGYLNRLRDSIMQDPSLAALDRSQLLGLLNGYGWLVIGAILALLFLGVCYDMLMAYLNSFFKQRAWNSITLVAGLLPQLLSVAAIVLLADEWDILGVLGATVLAPTIAVALAGWQVLRLWREGVGQATVASEPASRRTVVTRADRLVAQRAPAGIPTLLGGLVPHDGDRLHRQRELRDLPGRRHQRCSVAGGRRGTGPDGVELPLHADGRGAGAALHPRAPGRGRDTQRGLPVAGATAVIVAHTRRDRLDVAGRTGLLVISPQYLNAAPVVWALVPCLFAECLLTTAHNALIVYERLPIIVISRLLTLAVVAPLAWLLPGWLGLLGVALAFGLARVAAGAWATASGARLLGLGWPWRFTLRVSLATIAMAGLISWRSGAVAGVAGNRRAGRPVCARRCLCWEWPQSARWVSSQHCGSWAGSIRQDRAQVEKMRLPLKRWILRVLCKRVMIGLAGQHDLDLAGFGF
jgi:O-antigen/teichoic acid export membrane protein